MTRKPMFILAAVLGMGLWAQGTCRALECPTCGAAVRAGADGGTFDGSGGTFAASAGGCAGGSCGGGGGESGGGGGGLFSKIFGGSVGPEFTLLSGLLALAPAFRKRTKTKR